VLAHPLQEHLGAERLHLGAVLHHGLLCHEEVDDQVGRGVDEAERKMLCVSIVNKLILYSVSFLFFYC